MREPDREPKNLCDAASAGRVDLIETLLKSEAELNQHYNGHHALWYAARNSRVEFIRELLKFAHQKGWQIIEEAPRVVRDLALDLAVRSNNFFCVQALALHLPVPPDIFSFETAYIHSVNQIPLAVIALTKEEQKRKFLLDAAFLEAMKYPGTYENVRRIELLLELGASPHLISYDSHHFICPLAIVAGSYSASLSEGLPENSQKPILPLLLASLSSKTINSRREHYEASIRKFFEEETSLVQKEFTKEEDMQCFLYGKKVIQRAKWGSGGGFLHWASGMGHSEILDDIIESLYAHNAQSWMFYPDDYGNTALTCALLAGHEGIAKRLVLEELHQVALGGCMWLPNKRDRVYLLSFLNSEEINANFEAYQVSLKEFFQSTRGLGSSLLHWTAFSGHTKIIPDIIKCFRTHGIPLHHLNRDEQTPLDLARSSDHKKIVEILESTEEVEIQKVRPKIPDLSVKLLREYQRQVLAGEKTVAELEEIMPPDLMAKLKELKPNVSMIELLNPRLYQEEGKTPFMVLCEQNRVDLVQRLLPFLTTSDIEMQDFKEGNTAFHLACAAGALDVLSFLSQKYPYTFGGGKKNNLGLTPILCVGPSERKRIIEQDTSKQFLNSLTWELEMVLGRIMRFWGILPLNFNQPSVHGFIRVAIEQLKKPLEDNSHFLQAINDNVVLRAALGLSRQDFAVQEDYRVLVLDSLEELELEFRLYFLNERFNKKLTVDLSFSEWLGWLRDFYFLYEELSSSKMPVYRSICHQLAHYLLRDHKPWAELFANVSRRDMFKELEQQDARIYPDDERRQKIWFTDVRLVLLQASFYGLERVLQELTVLPEAGKSLLSDFIEDLKKTFAIYGEKPVFATRKNDRNIRLAVWSLPLLWKGVLGSEALPNEILERIAVHTGNPAIHDQADSEFIACREVAFREEILSSEKSEVQQSPGPGFM